MELFELQNLDTGFLLGLLLTGVTLITGGILIKVYIQPEM